MSAHTFHGFEFEIEQDGFSGDAARNADGDRARWNLVDLLAAQPTDVIAKLHADLAANLEGDGDYPALASQLCHQAVEPVTADWHRPDAASLMLSAV